MKTLILAATALLTTGAAYAQVYQPTADPMAATTITVDPTVAIAPSPAWTAEQRMLWEQQMAFHPGWNENQVALFEAMMATPPINWTAEQKALYQQHLGHIPANWTAAQRMTFEQQMAAMRTPWMSANQTASMTTATTLAAASDRIVRPSNADPEHDARGIAVISDPAVVPAGFNGVSGTGMGGPLVDSSTGETIDAANTSYPPCTATVTDNCIQLYERGVREALAGESTGVGGPDEPVAQSGTSKPAATPTTTGSTTTVTKPTSSDPGQHGGHSTGTTTTTTPDPAGTPKDDTVEPDNY